MATGAKFRITDPGIFWSLQTIEQLGKFSFAAPQIFEIHDAFLDTKKRKLLAAGYSCRRRKQGKGFLITLTKLGLGKDKVQKQQYWEVALKKNINGPEDWPKSKAQSRILKVTPGKKLLVIFSFVQTRITRQISTGKQTIVQANLDDVLVINKGKEQHFKILKLKIDDPSQEKYLDSLVQALKAKWSLKTEPLSKFERAIAMESSKTP
jgi:inorganic triphosphatase YgiF